MKQLFKSTVLLMGALVLSTSIYAQRPDESKRSWANYERYAADNAKVTTRPVAVFMGNSITDIWANMHGEFFTSHNYIGRGISGQVTAQMLARFQADVVALNPKVVTILAGTNDIAQNERYIELENIAQNVFSMCEIAKQHKIKVIICSVLPANKYSWRPALGDPSQKIIELNNMLKAYAKQHKITYVDYHEAMKDATNGLPEALSKDGVHPTMEGYAIMEPMTV